MRYYLIAGEASGDLHGSNLIREIRQLDPGAQIRCWGGDLMQAAGGELVSHYKERAFMGFLEVALNLRTILGFMKKCKQDLLEYKPDVVVFIDYPGFNIPMAQFAKKHGFKTIFYISPQVWAWKEGRVKTIREVVDKMLVLKAGRQVAFGDAREMLDAVRKLQVVPTEGSPAPETTVPATAAAGGPA